MKKKHILTQYIVSYRRAACIFLSFCAIFTIPLKAEKAQALVEDSSLSIQNSSSKNTPNTIHNLVIIGSGPAGLTAGIYAARAQLNPVIIEGQSPNGQLINATKIENWPGSPTISGFEITNNLREHAQKMGAHFMPAYITNVDFSQRPFTLRTHDNAEIKAHSVIIATGTEPKKLHCPGEQEYWGKGIASCATCDAPFYKNKKVIVVGTGKSAMRNIALLKKFTPHITILEVQSTPVEKNNSILKDPSIKILCNSTINHIHGNEKKITGAEIIDTLTGATTHLPTDGIFISIGSQASTQLFAEQIRLDKNGYIQVSNNTHTSVPGVFAAGTVFDYLYKQAITCVAGGCMAALDAQRYLDGVLQNQSASQAP